MAEQLDVLKSAGEDYIAHHGIKDQKWGVRRFQNPDGSLTEEGKKRYYSSDYARAHSKKGYKYMSDQELQSAIRRLKDESEYEKLVAGKAEPKKKGWVKNLFSRFMSEAVPDAVVGAGKQWMQNSLLDILPKTESQHKKEMKDLKEAQEKAEKAKKEVEEERKRLNEEAKIAKTNEELRIRTQNLQETQKRYSDMFGKAEDVEKREKEVKEREKRVNEYRRELDQIEKDLSSKYEIDYKRGVDGLNYVNAYFNKYNPDEDDEW